MSIGSEESGKEHDNDAATEEEVRSECLIAEYVVTLYNTRVNIGPDEDWKPLRQGLEKGALNKCSIIALIPNPADLVRKVHKVQTDSYTRHGAEE